MWYRLYWNKEENTYTDNNSNNDIDDNRFDLHSSWLIFLLVFLFNLYHKLEII